MNPESDASLIRAAYARLALPVEPVDEPVTAVRSRMRRRSRRRKSLGAVLVACLVVVLAVGAVELRADPPPRASSNAGGTGAASTGPLPDGASASCGVTYGRKTLRAREWAADATVTSIGDGGGSTVSVGLDVHTWYRGGSGASLQVRLPTPRSEVEDMPPAYGVGTRLLLSGVRSGPSLVPWGCGFTRYYDEGTAALWAQVFAR